MIVHCVFLNIKPDHDTADTEAVLEGLGELKSEVDGMIDYKSGPNRDFENKTPDFPYGFVVTFRDRNAHLAYETHPKHVELGGRLVGMCVGGADGIAVYDIEC